MFDLITFVHRPAVLFVGSFGMLMRATWRQVALLLLVCLLPGCKRSAPVRTALLSEIVTADSSVSGRGQLVRTTAIVTYSDPEWKLLFVEDGGLGMYISPPPDARLESGDRIEITGKTAPLGTGLEAPSVSVLSRNNPLPPPLRVTDNSALKGFLSQFVEVTGIVRWTGLRNGISAIQLGSHERPLWAYVRNANLPDLPSLGSEVSISGVSAGDFDNGQLRGVQLFSPAVRYVKILKAGVADPFSLPVKALAELKRTPADTLVHVQGRILRRNAGNAIGDGSHYVTLNLSESSNIALMRADIAGFWNGSGLEDAQARPLADTQIAQPHPAKTRVTTSSHGRAGITNLAQLKRLTTEAASSRKPVKLQAVVTYVDADWHILFVEDETAGGYINSQNVSANLRPGDLLDISGVTGPGGYAPVIEDAQVRFVRRSHLPTPVKIDLLHGNLARLDSTWSSFSGVIHAAREQAGHTILKMGTGATEVNVQIPALIHGADLVDKEVSATGVFGPLFNERRQAIGHQIFVPSARFLLVADSATPQPALSTIDSLRRYRPNADERHSVVVNGTVVLRSAADTIFVQDHTGGIEVRGAENLSASDGDQVSVRGFVLSGEYSPVLEDAAVNTIGPGTPPAAELVSAKSALEGHYDSAFVSMRGTLTSLRSSSAGTTLVLNDHGTFFEAVGPTSPELDSLRIGSELGVRGVCQVSVDRIQFAVRGYVLAFDSPQSVAVIKLGPWWDSRRISWALFVIVGIAAAATLWATLLRQQVETKTRELHSSIAAKRKVREFDSARNQVLEAIARNTPPPESMEHLALAVQQQIEGSVCLVALSSDAKPSLTGKPAPIVIAPELPESVLQQMQPVLASALAKSRAAAGTNTDSEDHDVLTDLLDIARGGGLSFHQGQVMFAFTGAGELAGLLMLLLKDAPVGDTDSTIPNILHSASRLVSLARDHWHMHERLLFDARHDALTGLPNRTLSEDRLEQALARARRRKQIFAVVCIDLDGFKAINDNFGHDAGDELLRTVAVRLRARIRHSDTLARVGGDEFLAIIEDCSGDAAAQSVAESLVAALQEPATLEGKTVNISGSIGIAMYPVDGKNAAELKRNADQAMYRAKSRDGGQICFWSQEPQETAKVVKVSSSSGS